MTPLLSLILAQAIEHVTRINEFSNWQGDVRRLWRHRHPSQLHHWRGAWRNHGAGKSTAMKAVFGMLPLREGSVLMGDRDITHLKPQDRVRNGMGFVPQNNNVFTSLTVQENLEMGAFIRRDDFSDTLTQVFDLFPVLKQKRSQAAGELSGGQRQQVAVGRALMTQPPW